MALLTKYNIHEVW